MSWVYFIVGLIVGEIFGIVLMCFLRMAALGDE